MPIENTKIEDNIKIEKNEIIQECNKYFKCIKCQSDVFTHCKDFIRTNESHIFKFIPYVLFVNFDVLNTRNLSIILDLNDAKRFEENIILSDLPINTSINELQNLSGQCYKCKNCLEYIGWKATSSVDNSLTKFMNVIILFH